MTVTQERVSAVPSSTGIPNSRIRSEWVLVTPELAKTYLGKNTHNRKIRQKHLERLAADMTAGRYSTNHQGIAFSDADVLLDGQHRCLAIVQSGVAQWMLVTHGLHEDAQVAVDQQAKRSAADFLSGSYGAAKTAAIRTLVAVEKLDHVISVDALRLAMADVTITEIHEAAPRYMDQIDNYCALAMEAAKNARGRVGPGSLLATVCVYPDVATELLEGLANNAVGLPQTHPATAILRWIGTTRVHNPTAAFLALKAGRALHFDLEMHTIRQFQKQRLNLDRATTYIRQNGKTVEIDAKVG